MQPPLKRLLGNIREQKWLFHISNRVTANIPLADGLSHISIQSGLTKYLKSFEEKNSHGTFGGVEGFKNDIKTDVCHCPKLSSHIQLLFCN